MSPPPHRPDDLAAVNHAIGVERGGAEPSPVHDVESPRDVHRSHAWTLAKSGRWMECARCGLRDHWPGCEVRCKVPASKRTAVALGGALEALRADLEAFARWWRKGKHPDPLPTVDEWAANFHEWRINR